MEQDREYIVACWYCASPFNAFESAFCIHATPSQVCPFCLHCICDAPQAYREQFWQECPAELLDVSHATSSGASPKLGELLVRMGKIDLRQLHEAMKTQAITKQKLGEILIMMELISPRELKLYLLNQKVIEEIDLQPHMLNKDLVNRLGKKFCLAYKLVPLEYSRIGDSRILRFAIPGQEYLAAVKNVGKFQNLVLIPYLADKEKIESIFAEMKDELEWENLLAEEKKIDKLF